MTTEELIQSILSVPEETQTIEFKRLDGPKIVGKVVQTIVAMANAEGGVIVLGIDDPEKTKLIGLDRIYGIEENRELYDEIKREIQRIVPPLEDIKMETVVCSNGKTFGLVFIDKASDAFRSINGSVFVRLDKSNKELAPNEIVKLSYAKGFEKADKELVDVDFALLQTKLYEDWRQSRGIDKADIQDVLFQTGLARKDENQKLKPTRAAVLLFANFPTHLMETKCAIRVSKYQGTIEKIQNVPNLIGKPKTIDGPIVKMIRDANDYILNSLESGIEFHSGFVTKYKIPERAIKEAVTNAVIHRDYHMTRDIEVKIFEDRVEIISPGLFPYNITAKNIGFERADGYRNDLLVKHLRDFPDPPNLDQNEGVRAMRNEMRRQNLYQPVFITYPTLNDSVSVTLINEEKPGEWEIIYEYLKKHRNIDNGKAREITNITQSYKMSRLFKKWTEKGLLLKIEPESNNPRDTRYKLPDSETEEMYPSRGVLNDLK